ncbi:S41 family peptidase [Flavobacterium agricola]|uniref:S41 family peptidase n=1 Tax=Flavobacterium agricola TaxID=2870839 RepID=UPI002221C720|nr:S41 family peptidase [Flavobacterium agricola]
MRKIFIKSLLLSATLAASMATVSSCSNDDSTSITDPRRFAASDVKSYANLFEVFWHTMDQRYNYFSEQKQIDGYNWDNIYKEYHPKFEALQTWGRETDDEGQINADYLQAKEYFTEIIDPIIDRHFNVLIYFPITNKNIITSEYFYGGMTNTDVARNYPFAQKYAYMQNNLATNSVKRQNFLLAGEVKTNPDIYYMSFSDFTLSSKMQITLFDKYLNPDAGNSLLLTEAKIDANPSLNYIADPAVREQVKAFTMNVLNEWNTFFSSAEVENFNKEIQGFKNTEVLSDAFVQNAQAALAKIPTLPNYSQLATYNSVINLDFYAYYYIDWFIGQMSQHVTYGYNLPSFQQAAASVINNQAFYKQFLNPLAKGEIKKVILDLRSNGGGAVLDARFFSDRFVTKETVFAYQRTKEGNGRFNYTPWIEAKTNPHKFGIPANIPIAILTDRGSASMSEITTLMLKSQGNQVVSIGDYSAGATAGLGTTDDFNGGTAMLWLVVGLLFICR